MIYNTNQSIARFCPTITRTLSDNVKYSSSELASKNDYDIFAYCSENYKDAYDFVINSWLKPNVKSITIYTDFEFDPCNERITIIPMFKENKNTNWIIGTGRRLDVIKDYVEKRKDSGSNVLFLDIDCYIVKDISHVFSKPFDIAITRLFNKTSYTNSTATAGLWFARLNNRFCRFFNDWYDLAQTYKNRGRGIRDHQISYVQYSFTDIARRGLAIPHTYRILPIDEKIYNSEHTVDDKWIELVQKYHPHILHFKGRRFRKPELVKTIMDLC